MRVLMCHIFTGLQIQLGKLVMPLGVLTTLKGAVVDVCFGVLAASLWAHSGPCVVGLSVSHFSSS